MFAAFAEGDWTMNRTSARVTPLVIIAAFITLTQATCGYAVTNATDGVQIALVIFFILYAGAVTWAFFHFLRYHTAKLYSPLEYHDTAQFLAAIYHTTKTPADAVTSQTQSNLVVGRWEHCVNGQKGVIELLETCWINKDRSGAVWILEGRRLKLIWPNPDADVGAWIDKCEVSADSTTYDGTNQVGATIHGRKIA
jgi:hypothetical protein